MTSSRASTSSPSLAFTLGLTLFIALACVAVLGGALWVQNTQGALPCALCVLQRMAYLGVMLFALLAALGFATGSRGLARAALWLTLLAAVIGIGLAAKHMWLVYHPEQTCGLDPLAVRINHWSVTALAPWLLRADGLCSDIPYLYGQPLPLLSGIGFAGLGLLGAIGLPAASRLGRSR